MGFVEGAAKRGSPVSACAEANKLIEVCDIWPALEILALKQGRIHQNLLRSGLARERRNCHRSLLPFRFLA
jgi:hypothetical protein